MKSIVALAGIFLFAVTFALLSSVGAEDKDYKIFFAGDKGNIASREIEYSVWDEDGDEAPDHAVVMMAWTARWFDVYAQNGTPDGEWGDKIKDHDGWPSWDPDVPDADPSWGPYYAFNMDTFSGTWNLSYYELVYSGNGNWIYTKPILSGEVLYHSFNGGTLKLRLKETDATWKGIWGVGDGFERIENVILGGGGLFYGEISCDGNGSCEGFIQPWPVHMK